MRWKIIFSLVLLSTLIFNTAIGQDQQHFYDVDKETKRKGQIKEMVMVPRYKNTSPFLIVMLDEKKMTQALLNLCVNAIQAMPEGGKLSIESSKTDKHVFISIADNGIGISENEIEKIFDPFFTKKEGGLGFGLPIVQRIIEDHKGEISCRSKVGEYTVFEIVLPTLYLA